MELLGGARGMVLGTVLELVKIVKDWHTLAFACQMGQWAYGHRGI